MDDDIWHKVKGQKRPPLDDDMGQQGPVCILWAMI